MKLLRVKREGMLRQIGLLFLALLCVSFLAGCAPSLPDVPAVPLSTTPASPQIEGPKGALNKTRARAVLSRAGQDANTEELISRTVTLMESLSGRPLTAGNKVTLLVDGPATYESMFQAIEGAADHINFETFIFSDDEVGQRFADAFIRKRAEGVDINLIYDAVGSIRTPAAFFGKLRAAGVNVLEFNPISPLKLRKKLIVSQRDHRKLVVIDGKVAFTGGVNVSGLYYGSSGSFEGDPRKSEQGWRDTHVRIEGPSVGDLQRSFLETWRHQKGPALPGSEVLPSPGQTGGITRPGGREPPGRATPSHLPHVSVGHKECKVFDRSHHALLRSRPQDAEGHPCSGQTGG